MLLVAGGGESAESVDEGHRLLSEAREKQRSISDADPENFDYKSELSQTDSALFKSDSRKR